MWRQGAKVGEVSASMIVGGAFGPFLDFDLVPFPIHFQYPLSPLFPQFLETRKIKRYL